jgi:hypothetical protein
MKCFVHRSNDAIGTCRACSKGLCAECAVDHGHALSCHGQCESEVSHIRRHNIAGRRLISAQKRNRFLAPGFYILAGVFFLIPGLWGHESSSFTVGLGALFIVFGVAVFLANKRWVKESSEDGT